MKHTITVRFEGQEPIIQGVPEGYLTEYLAKDPDGILYFVDRPRDFRTDTLKGYVTFCVFVGQGENMQQARLSKAERLRDGGTTSIHFDLEGKIGRIRFPTPLDPRRKPSVLYNGYGGEVTLGRII